jgi:hypothetical protein
MKNIIFIYLILLKEFESSILFSNITDILIGLELFLTDVLKRGYLKIK